MRDLSPSRHYHVWTDIVGDVEPGWSIEEFARALPHGSGLDTSYTIFPRRGGGLRIHTEHRVMKHGYYVGWYPVRVVYDRNSAGRLVLRSVRVNAEAGYGLADEFYVTFAPATLALPVARPHTTEAQP